MIEELNQLILLTEKDDELRTLVRYECLGEIKFKTKSYRLDSFCLGSQNPQAPVLFLVGGVHGLERIGAELCLTFLKSTIERMIWDRTLKTLIQEVRLVFIPLANPAGYYHSMRSNGRGVDLMRNAPVEAVEKVPFLLGGHRFSKILPWYRGEPGQVEAELQALMVKFRSECLQSRCVLSLDFHSGFGLKDRLWFPYSKTKVPFEHLAEMHAFINLFEQTYPYHVYQVEPQSHGYLLHGDLWDHLYTEFLEKNSSAFLPLTLEMGSWTWVKKNPLQLVSKHGLFNPIKEHRVKRTYRRHHMLFDFILRALYSYKVWSDPTPLLRHKHRGLALERWYGY